MKAFTFKQNRILKLRKQQVTIAELEVGRAASEVTSSQDAVEQCYVGINELDGHLRNKDRPDLSHISQMSVRLRRRLEESCMRLAERKQLLEGAIVGLRKATQAVEAITVLERRQREDHTRNKQKQEQATIDSFSTNEWVKKG